MPQFIINCSTEKWNEVKPYILLAVPNQTLNPDEANLSDNEWIKYKILMMVKNLVIRGKQIAANEASIPIEDDAFTIE